MRALYSGTWGEPGHHVWEYPATPIRTRYGKGIEYPGLPWKWLDSKVGHLFPSFEQGEAKLTHKDGWTALGFANYMDDDRPQSNSVFVFDVTLTFEECVALAKRYWPAIWERIDFEVKLVEEPIAHRTTPSNESVTDSTRRP